MKAPIALSGALPGNAQEGPMKAPTAQSCALPEMKAPIAQSGALPGKAK
jgi:hypothetical protein